MILSYDPYGKFRDHIQQNLLQVQYRITAEALMRGGDDIKDHIRKNLAGHMASDLMTKIKYTMIDDPVNQEKQIRARVYAFTEAELLALIAEVKNAG
jgi:hypothetical protein